jgi:trehalose 6-phosphate phosphatase
MDRPTPAARPHPPAPAKDWALFLDVDGCLIDFADAPDRVHVPAELRQRLMELSEALGGALALVSGRTVASLDQLFWPLKLDAAGLHGNELRTRRGQLRVPRAPTGLARIRAEAVALSLRFPGSAVENKGAGLALHWRIAPRAEAAMVDFAADALALLPGYRLQRGDCVIELVRGERDKGGAILELLEKAPYRGRLPVFAGDDLTDENGFQAVNARGGLSVLVGARASSVARFGVSSPQAVRDWLATWAEAAPAQTRETPR